MSQKAKRFNGIIIALMMAALTAAAALHALATPAEKWLDSADDSWYSDSETSFNISTPEQLAGLAELVNRGTDFSGKTITLTADINLSGKQWTPIGVFNLISDVGERYERKFKGSFNGGGHKITGLSVDNAINTGLETTGGLFANVGVGGAVSSLELTADISLAFQDETPNYKYQNCAGAIAAYNEGTIEGCVTHGSLVTSCDAGGIAGWSFGVISNCSSDMTIVSSGGSLYNDGVGGIVGNNSPAAFLHESILAPAVSGCTFSGSVTGEAANEFAGGIAGSNHAEISGCVVTGEITGATGTGDSDYGDMGGIAGENWGTISGCVAACSKLTNVGGRLKGAIVGYNNTPQITSCLWLRGIADSAVDSYSDKQVGADCHEILTWPMPQYNELAASDRQTLLTPAPVSAGVSNDTIESPVPSQPTMYDLEALAEKMNTSPDKLALNGACLSLAQDVIESALKDISVDKTSILPIVEASLDKSGNTAALCFTVTGAQLYSAAPETVKVMKLFPDGSGQLFEYAASEADYGDKKYTVLDLGGKAVTGSISNEASYSLVVFVTDGGAFDLDGQKDGKVIDPIAFIKESASTPSPTPTPEPAPAQSGGSSSGGCSAGVGLLSLLALAALPFAARKKK